MARSLVIPISSLENKNKQNLLFISANIRTIFANSQDPVFRTGTIFIFAKIQANFPEIIFFLGTFLFIFAKTHANILFLDIRPKRCPDNNSKWAPKTFKSADQLEGSESKSEDPQQQGPYIRQPKIKPLIVQPFMNQ